MTLRRRLAALSWAVVPLAALAADPPAAPVSADALKACAALATESARLACYDKLAGRVAPTPAAAAPAAAGAAAAATAAGAAASAPAASTPAATAAAKAAPAPSAAAGAPKAAAPATPAPGSPDAFGLYSAEHPKAPAPAKSETLKIVGLSASPNGYPIVALEGGQRWELYNFDGFDPKLTSGTAVTIQRASLGSFLLTTPGGRTHRVRRVQ